jgi:hypothetical protein
MLPDGSAAAQVASRVRDTRSNVDDLQRLVGTYQAPATIVR